MYTGNTRWSTITHEGIIINHCWGCRILLRSQNEYCTCAYEVYFPGSRAVYGEYTCVGLSEIHTCYCASILL